VTALAVLRRLAAFPRQNGLAMERTLFTLDWIRNLDPRRRAHAGLNKGEARNALTRALFFNRLGELRDRRFENQVFRASGLNLPVATIILWNSRYLVAASAAFGAGDNPYGQNIHRGRFGLLIDETRCRAQKLVRQQPGKYGVTRRAQAPRRSFDKLAA
jgi:Tn3 transposase DDE domain